MSDAGLELVATIPPEATPDRADKLLAQAWPDYSRSQIARWLDAGRVWRDDEVLGRRTRLEAGDSVTCQCPAPQPSELRPVDLPLDIIWEDDDLIALNKAAGMVVHPGAGTGEDTLVHALLYRYAGQLPTGSGAERPGIVHRLDRETSGVMLVAKTDRAWAALAECFQERRLQKDYLAWVRGVPEPTNGSIDTPIGRHPSHRTTMAVRPGGRSALTEYRVEQSWLGYARLRLRIHTGRTHQIRVHARHLGHSLLGDPTYGGPRTLQDGSPISRVCLHAARLSLDHPLSGQPLVFVAPLPDDLRQVDAALAALGSASSS